jgi:hypothetical protein
MNGVFSLAKIARPIGVLHVLAHPLLARHPPNIPRLAAAVPCSVKKTRGRLATDCGTCVRFWCNSRDWQFEVEPVAIVERRRMAVRASFRALLATVQWVDPVLLAANIQDLIDMNDTKGYLSRGNDNGSCIVLQGFF